MAAGLTACWPTDPDPAWNGGQPRTFSVQAPDRSAALAVAAGPGGTTFVTASADAVDPSTGQVVTATSVRRLLANGAPDLGWGDAGRAPFAGGATNRLLPTADGGVVAVAVKLTSSPKVPNTFTATRYSSAGQLVASWGAGGSITGPAGSFLQAPPQSYAVDAQGRLLVAFGANLVRYATSGLVDPTFAGGGTVTPSGGVLGTVVASGSAVWVSVAGGQVLPVHDDGSLGAALVPGGGSPGPERVPVLASGSGGSVSVGWSETSGARVARITGAGQLDLGFGAGGVAALPAPWTGGALPAGARFDRIAVDAAGGTVVGWSTVDAASVGGVRLVRATPGGAADASFGSAGALVVDGSAASVPSGASVPASEAVVSPTGPFGLATLAPVGAGVAITTIQHSRPPSVTAYDASGHLASGFGTGGTAALDRLGPTAVRPVQLLVLADGRAVAAVVTTGERLRLVRFTAAGTLDPTFGEGGVSDEVAVTKTDWRINPPTLLAAPGGAVTVVASGPVPVAVRYRADGTRLTTWASGGRLVLPTPPAQQEQVGSGIAWSASAAASVDGGLIVAVGQQRDWDLGTPHTAPRLLKVSPAGSVTARRDLAPVSDYDAAVTQMSAPDAQGRVLLVAANGIRRLKADLSNDATFGPEAGRPLPNRIFVPHTVLVGADAKPVVVGWAQDPSGRTVVLAVRYTATGGFDPTYGTGGVASITAVAPGSATPISTQGSGADLDLQGRVVVVGTAGGSGVLVRFTPAGKPDPALDDDGVKTWPAAAPHGWLAIDIGLDGKITVAATASPTSAIVARLEGRPAS